MDFRGAFRALKKLWWIVLMVTMLGAAAGTILTLITPAQYASSVTFFVRTPAEQIGGAYQGDQFAQKRVNSYVQLAESGRLAELVKADAQTDLTTDQITQMISAKGDLNTVLLTLTVRDTNPERSLDIARSLSTQFVELVSRIETPPGASTPTVSLEVTSEATLKPAPVAPRPLWNIGLGTLVGFACGVALALLRDFLDSSVRSVARVRQITASPVLASVPFDAAAKTSPLIVESHAHSLRAEAFRQLRTNLQFVDVDHPVRILVVTSSMPDEGKSSTATNLAVTFAEDGKRVLLIEADLRRPRVAEYLGIDGSIGLTNVLAGQVALDEVLQPWGRGGLSVLPCGSIPPNPSELLGSENMREMLETLRKSFDMVILDTPPLLPVTDGAIAAANADGAILVVRSGRTLQNQLASAKDALSAVDARLLGAVLNMTPVKETDSYGYGSYAINYTDQNRPHQSPSVDRESEMSSPQEQESDPTDRQLQPRVKQADTPGAVVPS